MKKVQFTKDGFANMQAEYDQLVKNKRPHAVERLHTARNMGDLSENSEYTAAKDDLALLEGRVQELEQLMKDAEIIENAHTNGTIDIGCHVKVKIDGEIQDFQIVGEFESDPLKSKLSSQSLIGKALIGKKKGDSIEVTVPAGKMTYQILEVN